MIVQAEVVKPFKWKTKDGQILTFEVGKRIRAPRERLKKLETRGYVRILQVEIEAFEDFSFLDPVEMIGRVIKEIEGFYAFGALRWARDRKPELYQRVEALEREINQLARARALGLLEVRLEQWRETIQQIVKEFLAAEEKACCA